MTIDELRIAYNLHMDPSKDDTFECYLDHCARDLMTGSAAKGLRTDFKRWGAVKKEVADRSYELACALCEARCRLYE